MSKLEDAYQSFAQRTTDGWIERVAFFHGAASMAEIMSSGQYPILQTLQELCKQLAMDAQTLRAQVKETGHQIAGDLTRKLGRSPCVGQTCTLYRNANGGCDVCGAPSL